MICRRSAKERNTVAVLSFGWTPITGSEVSAESAAKITERL